MPYDKYRNWPLPGVGPRRMMRDSRDSLDVTVLKDLSNTEDEVEKLEILDSYGAYCQRAYREEFAEGAAQLTGQQLGSLLFPVKNNSGRSGNNKKGAIIVGTISFFPDCKRVSSAPALTRPHRIKNLGV
jgi:hypothetical protein